MLYKRELPNLRFDTDRKAAPLLTAGHAATRYASMRSRICLDSLAKVLIMTEPPDNRPKFTHQQALRLWATFVKRWGELIHDQMMTDAERCGGLDEFEQAYLRAFWQTLTGRLRKLNTHPLPFPARTQTEVDSMWNVMALEFGFSPVVEALAQDVDKRLEFFKRKVAHEFQSSIYDSINRHGISSPIEQIFLIQWKYQRVEEKHGLLLRPQERIGRRCPAHS